MYADGQGDAVVEQLRSRFYGQANGYDVADCDIFSQVANDGHLSTTVRPGLSADGSGATGPFPRGSVPSGFPVKPGNP